MENTVETPAKRKLNFIAYSQLCYRDYFIYNGYGYPKAFNFVHVDYDGAPDAYDHRLGDGDNIEDCILQIDEQLRRD